MQSDRRTDLHGGTAEKRIKHRPEKLPSSSIYHGFKIIFCHQPGWPVLRYHNTGVIRDKDIRPHEENVRQKKILLVFV